MSNQQQPKIFFSAHHQYHVNGRLLTRELYPDTSANTFDIVGAVQLSNIPSPLRQGAAASDTNTVDALRKSTENIKRLYEFAVRHRDAILEEMNQVPRLNDEGHIPHYLRFHDTGNFSVDNIFIHRAEDPIHEIPKYANSELFVTSTTDLSKA